MSSRLRRWAAQAPVPVFVARGGGSGLLATELAAEPTLRLVASPRHATVLLAVGRFPGPMGVALDRVHDQMASPSRTLWWTADVDAERPAAVQHAAVITGPDPVLTIRDIHRQAVSAAGREPDVFPDVAPNLFEGRGDHGQGGEGMMGGVPYGRPMAMTGEDRDGLELDQQEITWGPFLVGLPAGLQVRTLLQGGLVQGAEVTMLDLGTGPSLDAVTARHDRRHHLGWLSEVLRLTGLDALAVRAARLARAAATSPIAPGADTRERAALVRRVRRSRLPASWAGLGAGDGGDARQRLEAHLEAIVADTENAAADATHIGSARLADVAALLVGLTWTDALGAIASLDLDVEAGQDVSDDLDLSSVAP